MLIKIFSVFNKITNVYPWCFTLLKVLLLFFRKSFPQCLLIKFISHDVLGIFLYLLSLACRIFHSRSRIRNDFFFPKMIFSKYNFPWLVVWSVQKKIIIIKIALRVKAIFFIWNIIWQENDCLLANKYICDT